ncbi:MAG: serine aminopeptidase domain-containing protein [Gemmatimonadaceae bacterium]
MNPFFFGDSGKQLFGVYHPAGKRSARGAVICYPWAREYLLAHPTVRLLAQRLAENGCHSLRFDYLGTGDSAGDATVGSERQWVEDIRSAVAELRDVAQVREIALIGMRFGATLAAVAAAVLPDISSLVLWDPVIEGGKYLAELGVAASSNGLPIDVQGGVLTSQLRQDLLAISPAAFAARLPRTLVVSTGGDEPSRLEPQLRSAGVDYTIEQVPDVQVWREEWGRGGKGLAASAVNRIVTWLD